MEKLNSYRKISGQKAAQEVLWVTRIHFAGVLQQQLSNVFHIYPSLVGEL